MAICMDSRFSCEKSRVQVPDEPYSQQMGVGNFLLFLKFEYCVYLLHFINDNCINNYIKCDVQCKNFLLDTIFGCVSTL